MKHPLVIIGAGAGGLLVAIGAAKAGKKVLLIDRGTWGGDCTNFGCIPSKSLIASGEKGEAIHRSKHFGLQLENNIFQANGSLKRVRETIGEIRSHEDPAALEKMGVQTLTGVAKFKSPHELVVKKMGGDEVLISAKTIVIATGSYPFVPPIEGLKGAPYLTNETIFDLKEVPKTLGILGAGPIGCELAQAFQRLGTKVSLIESERGLLPNEDTLVGELMQKAFTEEGLSVHTRCETTHITYKDGIFNICVLENGVHKDLSVGQLLIATGRRPHIAPLELNQAKITHTEKGIVIDKYGRTSQPHIFAVGDAVGAPFFTHRAENHARTVLTTLLLPGPFKKAIDQKQALPKCTFTSPEIASIGLGEKEAQKIYGEKKIATYFVPLETNDRAITASKREGFVKIVTKKWSSKILGATIAAPRAGEMLPELSLAMLQGLPLRKLARLIHPYPTYNGAIRKAADLWLTQTLLGTLRK